MVIVNWNSGDQLMSCLSSLFEYGRETIKTIIVVDNGSIDGSADAASVFEAVTVVRSQLNLGFAAACNLGARQTGSRYLLFLNPDALVFRDTLTRAVAFMDDYSNSRVGICGVQLIGDGGAITRSCARFPGALAFALSPLGLDRLFPRLGVLMKDWEHDETRDVDHVIGAFYLVRREVFELLDGFDENFFLYFEDLDFSLRARQLGWKCIYLAGVQAFHLGGGSSRQVKDRRLFYSLRSRVVYSFKHHGFIFGSFVLLIAAVVEPVIRSAWALARLSLSSLSETLKGYRLFWLWLPRWAIRGVTR